MDSPQESSKELPPFLTALAGGKVDFSTSFDVTTVKGKSVLVTGGANGIGAACVRAFADAGCYVTMADINVQEGAKLEKELLNKGFQVKFVETDVTEWHAQVNAFKTAIQFSPHYAVDIAVTCAGVATGPFLQASDTSAILEEEPPAPDMRGIVTNQMGTYMTACLAFHYFSLASPSSFVGKKSIVLIGSLAGYTDLPNMADYCSSKFGVRGLFRAMRSQGEARKATINMVAPTYVKTALTSNIVSRLEQAGVKFANMEDVVAAVMRVVSNDSIKGRAVGVGAYGNFDLCDDLSGNDASAAMLKYYQTGALGGPFGKAP